jgi:hypothetical protein
MATSIISFSADGVIDVQLLGVPDLFWYSTHYRVSNGDVILTSDQAQIASRYGWRVVATPIKIAEIGFVVVSRTIQDWIDCAKKCAKESA